VGTSTQYVRNGDVSLAYQVTGDGPVDLVVVSGFISHLELEWSNPFYIEYLRGLNSFARVIRFDKRGTGLSDPVPGVPSFEDRMEDVRVVMDAVGIERAALYGLSEGGPMSMLFAATYPERVSALVLYGTFACGQDLGDASFMNDIVRHWGEGRLVERFCPSLIDDQNARRMVGTYERSAASPGMVRALLEGVANVDARDILGSIQVPTLVIHRRDDMVAPIAAGRRVAEGIPGAEFVELPGNDHAPFIGDRDALTQTIEEFLTGTAKAMRSTGFWRRFCSPTSSARPSGPPRWAMLPGGHCSSAMTRSQGVRSSACEAASSSHSATACSPPSTGRPVRSAVPRPSATSSSHWESRSGRGFTPGSARRSGPTTWADSPSTSEPGCRRKRLPVRSWSRAR
jgi:pimeloyl-ACP methyl ester carboxylesterase